MATHSSILAWEIPWTEDPGGLKVRGVAKDIRYNLVLNNNNKAVQNQSKMDFSCWNDEIHSVQHQQN